MNRFTPFALAPALLTPIAAHADDGHWVDARRHVSLENFSAGSEALGRLDYAKDICRSKTGQIKGSTQIAPGWNACMNAQGYVWLWDSAAQIAANRKAEQDARTREALHDLGGALMQAGAAMQPHGCNGQVQPNGYFSTQCY